MRAVSPARYLWDNSDYHLHYRDMEVLSPRVFGVLEEYPIATNRPVVEGRFLTATEVDHAASVIVLGDEIRDRLFPRSDPLNKRIQLGHDTYTVVGVFEKKGRCSGSRRTTSS